MADTPAKPRGRRPSGADTRGVICRAALELFSSIGYDKVSLRAIAREADVDPALIHHYFSSKADLFAEVVLALPLDTERLVADVLDSPRDRIGPAAIAAYIAAYDASDGARERFSAMLRWAVTEDVAQRPLTEFVSKEVFGAIAEKLGHSDFKLRGQLAVSLVLGMVLGRYVLSMPAVAGAEDRVLIESLGRAMQQLLVEDW